MRTFHTSTCVCCQVFNPGSKVNPYTGGSMKDFTEVTGAVTTKGLITAVTDTLDSTHISQLQTSAQHDSFLQKDPPLAKVLVFTDKVNSTVLAKGLSWAYARRLLFAEVRPSDADGQALAQHYGVSTYPTILVLKVSRAHSHSSAVGGWGAPVWFDYCAKHCTTPLDIYGDRGLAQPAMLFTTCLHPPILRPA